MDTVLAAEVFVGFMLILNNIYLSKAYYSCSLTTGKTCSTTIRNDDVIVDCSNRGLYICIPNELNPGLTDLDVSNNWYEYLDERHLEKYRFLKVLKMRNMVKVPTPRYSMFAFRYIYNLHILDFTNFSRDAWKPEFTWPPNCREIYISNTGYSEFVGDYLLYLEKLDAHNSPAMFKFPVLHPLAPITVIDLKGNPINDLTSEKLSYHCKLQHLNLSSDLFSKDSYCECKSVENWMTSYNIMLDSPLRCEPESVAQTCDVKSNETLLVNRRTCIGLLLGGRTIGRWYIIISVVMVTLLAFLIPSYLYMLTIRKEQRRKHRKNKRFGYGTSQVSEDFDENLEEEDNADGEGDSSEDQF